MSHAAPPLAAEVLDRVQRVYASAGDPERAAQMAAYMRDRFPFLGIPAPTQRALAREVLAGLGRPAETDLRAVALGCWALPEREYQYFACDWLRRHARVCTPSFIEVARRLGTTKPWWDTVDALAAHLVGPLVASNRELVSTMDDFFIRKAIGLALREYAKTDAAAVRGYVRADEGRLSTLSVREALKNISG